MKYSTGALIDTRKDKSKDFLFKEIVASADPVIWIQKDEKDWRKYPIKNQQSSNQCVGFSVAKLLGIQHQIDEGEWIDFSATHLYERRNNFPSAGMMGVDAFNIAHNEGITLEQLYPNKTHNNDNERLNIKKHYNQVGEIFKISAYLSLPIQDIDTVASVIQRTGKGVMVWYWGTYNEWDRDVVSIRDNTTLHTAPVRHSVVAVDYILHNGKKALVIEDSWGNRGINGRRIITEDFHKQRNYYVGHIMNFKFEPNKIKEEVKIFNTHKFGDTHKEIVIIQNILKSEGLFPNNVSSTGFYGSITAKAILDWQLKHKVASERELNNLQGRVFGPASLKKFKELY
jgi:hypothetical protein